MKSMVVAVALWFSLVQLLEASVVYATNIVDSTDAFYTSTNVLGAPDGVFTDFKSSNTTPGFVVFSFGANFQDKPGDDVFIHLIDWDPGETDEQFRVLVSTDGSSFSSLGDSGLPTGGATPTASVVAFDLADAGFNSASFLKIQNLFLIDTQSGPDIDAVEVRVMALVPEPSTISIFALGLLGAVAVQRRKMV